MKNVISTDKAPAAIGPYSQAIEVNGMVYTSGIIPVVPATGEIPEGSVAQAKQAGSYQQAYDAAYGSAYQKAYDTAYDEAYGKAHDEAYEKAYDEAWDKILDEIDEKYQKAEDKYELNDPDFAAVPVNISENFYRNEEEDHDGDGVPDGNVRVFKKDGRGQSGVSDGRKLPGIFR